MGVKQDLILTVLPVGVSNVGGGVYLDFSVLVSPRLDSTAATATLGQYPDWAGSTPANGAGRSWPDTVAALVPNLHLALPGLAGAPYPVALADVPGSPLWGAHQPDAARFASIFPADTTVTPYVYKGMENRAIRSAPVGSAVDALHRLYGQFGFRSPTAFPAYADLVGVNAFGPMGFQQSGRGGAEFATATGEQRKATLTSALETQLAQHKAVPNDLTALGQATGIPGAATSMAFLEHQRFLQREPTNGGPLPAPLQPPKWDFHQIVAGLNSLPTMMRVLGLVLDLRAGPLNHNARLELAVGVHAVASLQLVGSPFLMATTNVVTAQTRVHVATDAFVAAPANAAAGDHVSRMLKIGDQTVCRVVRVDHDSAAIKAIQFANNVTRSRIGAAKLTQNTPDSYALPALRTGGFAVARSGRSVQMHAILARQTHQLQEGWFGSAGTPTLFEDDLVRGYRFDVLDVADGVWRSLMWRAGTVTVDGHEPLTVTEEDTVVPAPTAPKTANGTSADLYLQETLTRWDGWSLAVPRVGTSFQGSNQSSNTSGSSGFNVTTEWHVPASTGAPPETTNGNALRLPRLRFGRTYQLRARVADLAGNSLLVAAAPHAGVTVTPTLKHLRYEPVAAPRLLMPLSGLWQVGDDDFAVRPGDSEEVVVIRSESATVDAKTNLDNAVAGRLVIPAPTSVIMAEQHGAFDQTGTGRPLDPDAYADIANRDEYDIRSVADLLDPDRTPGTTNPYLYPDFLPVEYLPDVLGRTALVRNLPLNAFKQTTAQLPFDTAEKGWPDLQATRVRLTRGNTDWTTRQVTDPKGNVTTELDLTLAKGVMVTTLVNCGIQLPAVQSMALWEWIQDYAQAHGQSTTGVLAAILAGEHWMFTPWRAVTFVHAVRTPLKRPVLLLDPVKTAIGQTHATFTGTRQDPNGGTIEMSRRSTARVDVDAAWAMPVDTGTNLDPVTPVQFTGHAFSVDLDRDGAGWIPQPNAATIRAVDAQNLPAVQHEFNDTKYRAVTYSGTATSYYVEYFRQHLTLPQSDHPIADLRGAAYPPGVAFEGSTVELVLHWADGTGARTRKLVPAPPGTAPDVAAPTPGDYVVVEDPTLNTSPDTATNGTVQILANATLSDSDAPGATVEFSYVGPTIHTFSDPAADKSVDLVVPNSARPRAPHVRYVIPIYQRAEVPGSSVTRTGGGLRVYLDRPWWSSGDEERLGVVCWHRSLTSGALPGNGIAPYVTQWGFDPIFKSSSVPAQPTPASFPLAVNSRSNGSLTIEESNTKVDVAGHVVGYDSSRRLWYCDIQVTDANQHELTSYTPFIRLALARYQPNSIPDAHLSRVVLADYAQLAPNRHLTVTRLSNVSVAMVVTVVGRSPRATTSSSQPNKIVAIVEQRDDRIPDDALAWSPATDDNGDPISVTLTAATSGNSDEVTWTGTFVLPRDTSTAYRLTIEEYERHAGGAGIGRLAYTESIQLTQLPR